MFKSKLIIILLCLCVVAGIANAQEKKPQVIQSEPQLEDIYNVLEAMDIHMFRFELKEFLNKVYTVTVYMDEYENGKFYPIMKEQYHAENKNPEKASELLKLTENNG